MSVSEEIKQNLDIVAVVSSYAPLTKAGRNFKARCPFHSERTPSFYVFPDRQAWHCFGACGTGGDVFSFVMRQENLQFGEALRLLAGQAGIVLREPQQDPQEDQRLARLREAHQAAALFYHNLLLRSPEAEEARAYVRQRGIDQETAEAFLLGYSASQWGSLKGHLDAKGFSTTELVEAGLLSQGDTGAYDRFRGRLMFPIRDGSGSVIGFGARSLDGSQPKYLNSPQTPLFDKSGTLYALDRARETIRREKQAVIVEGYMDAIMAHQHGFSNVVASMGTSLTEKQVSLLSRLAPTLVLALDPDAAGQAATLRGLEVAPEAMGQEQVPVPDWTGRVRRKQVGGKQVFYGLPEGSTRMVAKRKGEIRVLELPQGKDPDDLIREDPSQWEGLLRQSKPMLDFLLESAQERLDLASPKGKAQMVEELLPVIRELPNAVEQVHYLQRLAGLVGVDERTLRGMLPRQEGRRGKTSTLSEPEEMRRHFEQTEPLEDYCLALLLRFQSLRPQAAALRPEHFLSTETRELFRALQAALDGSLETVLDEALSPRLEEVHAVSLPPMTEGMAQKALFQCIHRLEERRLRGLKLHHRLRFAQEEGEQGAKEIAVLAYNRWRAKENGEETTGPEESQEGAEVDLVQVQEQEVTVNRQLYRLMRDRPLGSTPSSSRE